MTALCDIIKLDNYEDDDIFDVVIKLQRSFGLDFKKDAFINVQTFGDLCDVFENHIQYEHNDGCTKQQAFYKVRKALSEVCEMDQEKINPETRFIELFPLQNRRKKTKEFVNHLAIKVDFLTYPDWLALLFIVGIILSLITFIFNWKIAVTGIVFFISAMKLANRLAKDLRFQTVRELTEKIAMENYKEVRRIKRSINRTEVLHIITQTFSNELDIDKAYLTRNDKFGWAT